MKDSSFKIRLCSIHSLIFFVSICLISCSGVTNQEISIVWQDDKAIGLQIPGDMNTDEVEIRLIQEGERVAILGEIVNHGEGNIFKPLIPFTRGLNYEILLEGEIVQEIFIPFSEDEDSIPKLLAVYPTLDTVPENLLKVYLKFNQPMKEGVALDYLSLLNDQNDTIPSVFLNLQPELWNEDRTQLTIWLDPGRIKRDLIPNLEMGAPLENRQQYELRVSEGWKAQNGLELVSGISKDLIVGARDSLSPDPNEWVIITPKANSKEELNIEFLEALDYSLLHDVFKLKNEAGKEILGSWTIGLEEKSIKFLPADNWKTGNYTIQIESRLEDLAGNNLNRLFETDLESPTQNQEETSTKILKFSISN